MFSMKRKKPERPVWSHKTEDGFLERFLRGETEDDRLPAGSAPERPSEEAPGGVPAAADERAPDSRAARTASADTGEAGAPARGETGAGGREDAGGDDLKERIIAVLRQIYDPEIPVNLYDLGLVYGIDVSPEGDVEITMTLTTPHCPVAESMPYEVESRLLGVEGVRDVHVQLVWDPPWDISRMSDEARLELGLL